MIKDILDLSFLSGEKRKLCQRVVLLDLTFPSGEKRIFCQRVDLLFLSCEKKSES